MSKFSRPNFVRSPSRDGKPGNDGAQGHEPDIDMRDAYGRPVPIEFLDALARRQSAPGFERALDPNRARPGKRTHCEVIYWPFAPRPETR